MILFALVACENFNLSDYLPTVAYDELSLARVDWDGVDGDFVFVVDNPNPIDVKLARFDYQLAFEGVEWLTGDSPDGLELGAASATDMALPITLQFTSLYDVVQATRGLDDIEFELSGSFGFDTPLGPIDLDYDEYGSFPALRAPDISFARIQVADYDWSGATVDLKLDVDNDHGSTLDFLDLDYAIELAGVDVATGFVDALGSVEGATSDTLDVPFEVDFLDAGTAVYSAITSGAADAALEATVEVETPFGQLPLDIRLDQSNVDIGF